MILWQKTDESVVNSENENADTKSQQKESDDGSDEKPEHTADQAKEVMGDTIKYQIIRLKNIDSKSEEVIYGHGYEFKDKAAGEIDEIIDKKMPEFINKTQDHFGNLFSMTLGALQNTIANGYVGFRMAPQFLPGHALIQKTKFIGILGEIRGGPLEGIRIYYDTVPKTTATVDDLPNSIEWSRLVVGYSFGFNFSRFVDRIDVVPKIGAWSFHSNLSILGSDDVYTLQSFDMNRQFSLGIETGAEWSSGGFLTRAWFASDQAFPLGDKEFKVGTMRTGLDLWYKDGPKLFSIFKTAFLGFMFAESNNLERTGLSEEDSNEISKVSYINGYLGGGLAISW